MAVVGRTTTVQQDSPVGVVQVRRMEFRCLTCGAQCHADGDEDDPFIYGHTRARKPYVLSFCSCEPDLFVPVTMIGNAP